MTRFLCRLPTASVRLTELTSTTTTALDAGSVVIANAGTRPIASYYRPAVEGAICACSASLGGHHN
jgi:hypothetical protein